MSSRHQDVALDLLEAQRHSGPCLDNHGSGKPVPPVSLRGAHVAARWRTGVDEAFAALRRHARRHRLPLDRVATAVIEDRPEAAALRDSPSGPSWRTPGERGLRASPLIPLAPLITL